MPEGYAQSSHPELFAARVPFQRGSGLFSFASSLFRRAVPFLSKGLSATTNLARKAASSGLAQDIKKTVVSEGSKALSTAIADTIEGKDPTEAAKTRLKKTRTEIANILRDQKGAKKGRKKRAPPRTDDLSEEDDVSEDQEELEVEPPKKKRSKVVVGKSNRRKPRRYSVFNDK